MKRSLVIIFLGVLIMNANAQDSTTLQHKFMFGIHGGAGPASMVGSDRYWGVNATDLTYMIGSLSGVAFQCRVSQRVSLCFETNFERKGYTSGRKTTYIYDCISIPALVQFKINSCKKRTEWFVKSGLSPEYLVRTGVTYENTQKYHDIHHIDFCVVAGFGVNIPIKKHVVISIEGRDNLAAGDLSFKKHNLLIVMAGLGYRI